jgi:hypothetical protein
MLKANKHINKLKMIVKIIIVIIFSLISIIFIEDLFTTSFEISFPFEAGGLFYSSLEIYVVRGIVFMVINFLPVFFLICFTI